MFREMRRKNQSLSHTECVRILEHATSGVLAVAGDHNYPYAVPLSFIYDKSVQKLYFHCAKSGHKLDAIRANSRVSFCVIDQDTVIPEKYTTYFRSVIVFGRIRILEDAACIQDAAQKLARKYAPDDSEQNRIAYIEKDSPRMFMLELQVEHMTGKEAMELKQMK